MTKNHIIAKKYNIKLPIIIKDKEFNSINEACKYFKIHSNTVYHRLRKGETDIEKIFEPTEVVVDGKTFNSLTEACRYYNMKYNVVHLRYTRLGWTIEEAFGLVKRSTTRQTICVGGRYFKTKVDASEFYNVDYETVLRRLRSGWTMDEAFGIVEKDVESPLFIKVHCGNRTFPSIASACRYYNLEYNRVLRALSKGKTLDDIFSVFSTKE